MKKNDRELELLSLSYTRYVSRAHTTFSACVEAVVGITIGYIGLILSYLQLYRVPIDKFKIISSILISVIISIIICCIGFFIMYHSRVERKEIVRKIKLLRYD